MLRESEALPMPWPGHVLRYDMLSAVEVSPDWLPWNC